MERSANIDFARWPSRVTPLATRRHIGAGVFAGVLVACALLSAGLASWLPLQISIVTVFLFAGPHNWFELRYFLTRLPVRFGKSRNFFLVAFAGIGFLTLTYLSLPVLNSFGVWAGDSWPTVLATWNTLLLLWVASLVLIRGRQKRRVNWLWAFPAAFGLCALNWLQPEFFSLAIVYLHPLVALWFLDRHLSRTRPEWLRVYRRCFCLLPLLVIGMIWQLGNTTSLADDNGLFWRITQHAGAQLLPGISSHVLVSVHLFLEMLHYGVWIIALPLITRLPERDPNGPSQPRRAGSLLKLPLARHPRGFPKLIAAVLVFGLFMVALLWFGFSVDYSTTRDVYFTVAIAHVLAEAPFLLKML